jgi:hypothetical protein
MKSTKYKVGDYVRALTTGFYDDIVVPNKMYKVARLENDGSGVHIEIDNFLTLYMYNSEVELANSPQEIIDSYEIY